MQCEKKSERVLQASHWQITTRWARAETVRHIAYSYTDYTLTTRHTGTIQVHDIQTPECSKTYMDERKPLGERRAGISKMSDSFVQRSCSLPIIRPCAVPKQLLPRHTRRKPIADRPHRTDDSPVTREQHSHRNVDGLVRETLVACRRLTCREKGEATTGPRQRHDVRYRQAALIGETKSAVCRTRGMQNGPSPPPSSGQVLPRPCRQTTPGGWFVLKEIS